MAMTAHSTAPNASLPLRGSDMGVIQAPKPELCFMRYELTDYEWAAVRFGIPLPK
jgi:hypothetical protein